MRTIDRPFTALATGTEAQQLEVFRRLRDEMRREFEGCAAGLRDAAALSENAKKTAKKG